MNVTLSKEAIVLCRMAGVASFLWGHKGLGKSSLHDQLCSDNWFGFIDMRISQMEAADIRGLPDKQDNLTVYLAPAELPRGHKVDATCPACTWEVRQAAINNGEITEAKAVEDQKAEWEKGLPPQKYCKGILFLDEPNRGEDDVLQAIFQLVYDRRVGSYQVPDGWSIHCAGNFGDGDYMTNNFNDAAFLDRFCHLTLDAGEQYMHDWSRYMLDVNDQDVSQKILQFVAFNPNNLCGETKGQLDFTIQPSPRSWDMVAKVEKVCKTTRFSIAAKRAVIAGLVGLGYASSYEDFSCEVTPVMIMDDGLEPHQEKIEGLSRNAMIGLIWGIKAICAKREKNKKFMNNVIDFMAWIAQHVERDLAVSLGKSLVEEDGDDICGAFLSNTELADLASQYNLSQDADGIFWINLINEREDLQEMMAKVAFARDPDET